MIIEWIGQLSDSFRALGAPLSLELLGAQRVAWLSPMFLLVVGIGFFAQLVDGALGMAYGVTSSSLLLFFGVPPQAVSASVHAAEIATTGVSGISHGLFGNVDVRLMCKLAVPGVFGGVLGAMVLVQFRADWLKSAVSVYLLGLGLLLLYRAWRWQATRALPRTGPALGLIAGFLDAVGGGGWGPLTTGSLLAKNIEPRIAIGSANAAEFFVTVAIAAVLFAHFGLTHLQLVLGLILGGVIAAPVAAMVTKKISARVALSVVGSLVVFLSGFNLAKSLWQAA
jgi:uncharacterized protein